jgi:hypothetical protein
MDEQARLTDLVPTRLSLIVVFLVLGLGAVAGLEALYAWMPRLSGLTTDGRVAAFDLDGEGSLAVWFSSMTLAMAGVVAVLVFTVRRHRRDDYSGRYRVWLWAAMCWFLLSLDETASLHEGFKEMMACVTGTRLFGDGSIWWVSAYFFLLAAVGIRLVIDMRDCWLAATAMFATAGCYVLAVLTQLEWILPESGARGVMLEEGAEMVGNLFILLAMVLYARHVILDAQGRLPQVKTRISEARRQRLEIQQQADVEDDEEAYVDEDWKASQRILLGHTDVKVHPPHGASRPAAVDVAASSGASRDKPVSSPTAATSVSRKLTKAEKKALRRKLRQAARQREKQGG